MANADSIMSKELATGLNQLAQYKRTNSLQSVLQYLNSSLSNVVQTRDRYFKELVDYRNNYIVNGIYDILSNDILNDTSSADTILVSCEKDKQVEEEIKKIFDRLGLVEIIQSILPDLLHYGVYPLRPIVIEGKGVVDLVDDLYPNQVIAITDTKNEPLFFYVNNQIQSIDEYTAGNGYSYGNNSVSYLSSGRKKKYGYQYLDITELVYFSIDLTFSKLLLPEEETQHIKSKTPDFLSKLLPRSLKVRTSQSFIYPVLDKLKEVLALDKYTVYKSIGDVLTPKLVGIPLPQTYNVDQLADITQTYNDLINDNLTKTQNLQNLEVTLQELASVKVLPIAGDRSTPSLIDTGRTVGENTSNLQAVDDALGRLLNALGISKELFDGSSDSKENIKTAVRYAKKVKRISKNITRTLKFIALLHISSKFPDKNILISDIDIQLRNNLNLDELQNLETQDLVITSIENMKSLLEGFEDIVKGSDYEIDKNLIVENTRNILAMANSPFLNVFKLKEKSDLTAKEAGKIVANINNPEGNDETR